jgi:hypothetical protein
MEKLQNQSYNQYKEITYENVDKAGVRDWILNYFYDLSVFKTRICNKLTGITLRHTDEYIYSIELFYDNNSTGEFKGKDNDKNINHELKRSHIEISNEDFVSYVKGSYNVDYITGLEFYLNSGVSGGFSNKPIKDKTDIKYFIFKKEDSETTWEIISFKLAFGKFLTFISPIFNEKNEPKVNLITNELNKTYSTPSFGRFSNSTDLKHFSVKEDFEDLGRLNRIHILHDHVIVKGIELNYESGVNFKFNNYPNPEYVNKLKMEVIDLMDKNYDFVNKIMIRSGDLIDNITLYTNKDQVISAGGHGGCPYIFNINENNQEYGKNLSLIGVEGGFANSNLQYIKFIFI